MIRALARHVTGLASLPRGVALLYLRCLALAVVRRDGWSLRSATRPHELAKLVELAGGRRRVIEVGTGTAWTAMALAVADSDRYVVSYDPVVRPHRDRYLSLVDARTRERMQLVEERAQTGPDPGTIADMLFIDGEHSREATTAMFRIWEPVLAPGGVVAFHDYGPAHLAVAEAVENLDLDGDVWGNLFLWQKQANAPDAEARG